MKVTRKQLKNIISKNLKEQFEPFSLPTGGPEGPKFPSSDADPDRKYRREQEKRKLAKIKLKQKGGGFLDSRVVDLKSISLGYSADEREEYLALGYANKEPYNKGRQIAVFLAPKNHENKISLYFNGGKIKSGDKLKITNLSGRSLGTFGQHALDTIKNSEARILMYIPSTTTDIQIINKKNQYAPAHKIYFRSALVDIGLASGADWAIETLMVLGAIPGFGNAFDAASVGLALAKKPKPDVVLAAVSVICMLPLIGIGFYAARSTLLPLFRAAYEGSSEATGKIIKYFKEKGVDLTEEETINLIKREAANAINAIAEEKRLEQIALLTGQSPKTIEKNLKKVEEILNNILDNITDHGGFVSDAVKASTRKATKDAAKRLLKDLITGGALRSFCIDYAKKIAKSAPDGYYKKGWSALNAKEFIPHIPERKPMDFLKKRMFREESDFEKTFLSASKSWFGGNIDKAKKVYKNMKARAKNKLKGPPKPMKPIQIEETVDVLLKDLQKTKIRFFYDPKMVEKEFARPKSTLGHYDPSTDVLTINMTHPSQYLVKGKELERVLYDTIQHELLHLIDKKLLTILAGGQHVQIYLRYGHNKWYASQFSEIFKSGKGLGKIDRYLYTKTDFLALSRGFVSGTKIDDISNHLASWQKFFLEREGFLANHNFFDDFVIPDNITNRSLRKEMEASQASWLKTKKKIAADLAYLSNPTELFVRTQRISYWLADNGFKPNDWSSFFIPKELTKPNIIKQLDLEDIEDIYNDHMLAMMRGKNSVQDADMFRIFFDAYQMKILAKKYPEDEKYKGSVEMVDEIETMLNSLIGR